MGVALRQGTPVATAPPVAAPAPTKTYRPPAAEPLAPLPASIDTLEAFKDPLIAHRAARIALWLDKAALDDVKALWELINDESPPSQVLIRLVMSRWVMLDPQGALAACGHYTEAVWAAWVDLDPDAARQAAAGSDAALAAVARAMAATDPDRVLTQLLKGEVKNASLAISAGMTFLAQRQYEKAMEASAFSETQGLAGRIFKDWLKDDPERALAWASNPGLLRTMGMPEQLAATIYSEHPELLPGLFDKYPAGQTKQELQAGYARLLGETDLNAALDYAAKAEGRQQIRLMAEIGTKMARVNPQKAAEVLRRVLDDGGSVTMQRDVHFLPENTLRYEAESPVATFAEELAKHMPEAALDAVYDSGGNKEYENTARLLAKEWLREDAYDFATWLMRQQGGALRDDLTVSLAERVVDDGEPAYGEALNWLATMNDAGARDRQLGRVLSAWNHRAPDALRGYLSGKDVPAVVHEQAERLNKE